MLNYHRERFKKLTFRALALRQSVRLSFLSLDMLESIPGYIGFNISLNTILSISHTNKDHGKSFLFEPGSKDQPRRGSSCHKIKSGMMTLFLGDMDLLTQKELSFCGLNYNFDPIMTVSNYFQQA